MTGQFLSQDLCMEVQLARVPSERPVVQSVLTCKQTVVHLPEMSLCRGSLGNLRRMLRVRMDIAHREMTECEAELVSECVLQSADNIQCSAAVRTFKMRLRNWRWKTQLVTWQFE